MAKVTTTSKKDRVYKRKRRRRQATAVVFMVLALVGCVTLVTLTWRFIRNTFFDDTREKEQLETMIAPLVALDPAPFSSPDTANGDTLLQAAIRGALTQNDTSRYERNEEGLLIPVTDVTRAASGMYGSGYALSHHTITSGGITYTYEREADRYIVPNDVTSGVYYPVIVEITTSGNSKTLLVAYTQMSTSELQTGGQGHISKYMEYVLIRDGGDYYIYAVRETDYRPE